jgi:RNA polymerase sigma-70 factor (ECF subfamily)
MLSKAYILTNDYEACNDIVQECWLQIIKGINGLKDPKFFGVWVYRIVQGKSVDWIRDRQKQRKTLGNEKQENNATSSDIPGDKTDQDEAIVKLRIALKELPPDQQFILSIHYLENHPVNEIGEILEIPVGTVKSRLFHARKNLLKTFRKIRQ